jgi:hypothetical protein
MRKERHTLLGEPFFPGLLTLVLNFFSPFSSSSTLALPYPYPQKSQAQENSYYFLLEASWLDFCPMANMQ